MTATNDIHIHTNADYRLSGQFLNSDGSVKSMVGASMRMQIRGTNIARTLYGTWTSPDHFVISNSTGRFNLTIPLAQTSTFTFNNAVYDIVVTWPNGEKDVIMKGKVDLEEGVTV